MSVIAYAIVVLVALQRLAEILYARRNTARLLAQGAKEVGRTHYPLLVVLHAAWLAAIAIALPAPVRIVMPWLAFFIALQGARLWVIWSLGPYWTTRIVTMESAPLVQRGPYRLLRHPNYMIVVLEIAVLPLAFREYAVAFAFSIANAAVLALRITVEERALAPRRAFSGSRGG